MTFVLDTLSLPDMKLLLHVCCAPDATTPYQRLKDEHNLACFFYNPNIDEEEEYKKRLREAEKLSELWNFELIEGNYDVDNWRKAVEGLEAEPEGGKRCWICYRLRLEEAAKLAKKLGYDAFATTLTISPHKKAEKINAIGRAVAEKYGVSYLESDFKKKNGFKESVEWSKKLKLYRQNYCGCSFSRRSKKEPREK